MLQQQNASSANEVLLLFDFLKTRDAVFDFDTLYLCLYVIQVKAYFQNSKNIGISVPWSK